MQIHPTCPVNNVSAKTSYKERGCRCEVCRTWRRNDRNKHKVIGGDVQSAGYVELGESYIPPNPDDLTWCDLSMESGWVRRLPRDTTEEYTVSKGEEIETIVRSVFDPGVVYPRDWNGPLWNDINVPKNLRRKKDGIRYAIISMAQDKTPVVGPVWNAVLAAKQYFDAELIIGASTYARDWFDAIFGGTGRDKRKDKKAVRVLDYSGELDDYLVAKPTKLANKLHFKAEMNIIPTARHPLSGLLTYGQSESCIFPHPRQDLESTPRDPDQEPVIAMSTGAVTAPNYVDRKTGHIARFHHLTGFILVEIDEDGQWWAEHMHCDINTGRFQYRRLIVDGLGNFDDGRVKALIYGDAHPLQMEPEVKAATWDDEDSISKVLDAEDEVVHDSLDFWERNHHTRADPFHRFEAMIRGVTVGSELELSAHWLDSIRRPTSRLIVAKSNHDEAFTRWLKEVDPRTEPSHNIEIYHKASSFRYAELRKNPDIEPDAYEFMMRELAPTKLEGVIFAQRDDTYLCGQTKISDHHDKSSNGSRGSVPGFLRTARRTVGGHDHTICKREGVTKTGHCQTMTPMPKYARGGTTTWAWAHVYITEGDKTVIAVLKKGTSGKLQWRAKPKVQPKKSKKRKS